MDLMRLEESKMMVCTTGGIRRQHKDIIKELEIIKVLEVNFKLCVSIAASINILSINPIKHYSNITGQK